MNNIDTNSASADEAPITANDAAIAAGEPSTSEVTKPAASPASVEVGGMMLHKRARKPGDSAAKPAERRSATPGKPTGAAGPPRLAPKPPKRMERYSRVMPSRDPGVRMNEQIRVSEVRVINEEGQMIGVMSPREATELARSKQMDLIEIVPHAKPPVCKIIEFGKWKYEQQKRQKLAKKSSHQQLLKEVRFHPHTDTHDFEFKVRHARNFIEEGHKVKAYVQFKGREVAYKQFGEELLKNFKERMEDVAKVDQSISMMGRTMSMILSPGKKSGATDSRKHEEESEIVLKSKRASAKGDTASAGQ